MTIFRNFYRVTGYCIYCFLGYFLFINSNGNYSFIPTVGLIVFVIQKSLPYYQQIYNSWATLKTNYGALKKVLNIIELPVVKFSNHSKFSKYELKRTIVFENVSFKFNDEPGRILDNVNLTINKGEKIGVLVRQVAEKVLC